MCNARVKITKNCSFVLTADSLADVVFGMPDLPGNAKLYDTLAQSESAKVRLAVANKSRLTVETVQRLSKDKTQAVLMALINNESASQYIARRTVMAWIAADDSYLLQAIFENLPHMPQIDAADIASKFARHADPAIRLDVARASETDVDLLELLCDDEDPDVREAASNELRTRAAQVDDDDLDA